MCYWIYENSKFLKKSSTNFIEKKTDAVKHLLKTELKGDEF